MEEMLASFRELCPFSLLFLTGYWYPAWKRIRDNVGFIEEDRILDFLDFWGSVFNSKSYWIGDSVVLIDKKVLEN